MSWQDKLREVEPYVAGEQPKIVNMIKLNTNENPYGPSPKIKEVLTSLDIDRLRLYPNSDAVDLRKELANYYGLEEEQVFLGNGSDEVLALIFLTFFNGKEPILFPDITYSFYPVYCELYQMAYKLVKLDRDFKINLNDFMQPNSGIIFPNPNAPTGLLVDLDFIETILKNNPDSIVVIDEAYIDFAGRSALELIDKYDNLIVVQTFSKARSMAGMRIGYAISNPTLIKYLNDAKYSFNSYTMNQTSIVCGVEAVKDREYFENGVRKIVETREWAKEELTKLGFTYLDSGSNFIFAKHPEYDAKELFEALKAHDIYVRFWGSERIEQYMRISIGTREEMEQLFAFLKEYMWRGSEQLQK